MWFALFWAKPLQPFWRRALRERHWRNLQKVFPLTWVIDPEPVPHHAVIPWLEIRHWEELKRFSHKTRDFVLKVSGFSEQAWGSRGVYLGSDLPQSEWGARLDHAIASFETNPFILQRFHKGDLFEQKYLDPTTKRIETMRGRVRLCPYYFVDRQSKIRLGGALATIVPADKKLVHGMRDGILVPAAIAPR